MGFITMLSREAGTIAYGTRMIEQDRINLSVQVDLGNCSQEAYTPTTDVTALTDDVIWFENNFYIPTGVTEFSFEDNGNYYVWTWNVDTWDSVEYEIVSYDAGGDAITNIDPATITYDTDRFLVPTAGSITSFTFDKGATAMEATFSVDTWSFAEVVDPAEALLADGNTLARYVAQESDLTHGSPVSQWNDISGNDRHLVQATVDSRPAWDAVEGEVTADGIDDAIKYYNLSDVDILIQPISIFLVVKRNSYTDGGVIFVGNGGSACKLYEASSDRLRLFSGSGPLTVSGVTDNYLIVRAVINAASSYIRINDSVKVEGDVGVNDLGGGIEIGSLSGSTPCNYSYKELIVRSGSISDVDSDTIYNYLIDKYSIV
jgi:hypothetical protein